MDFRPRHRRHRSGRTRRRFRRSATRCREGGSRTGGDYEVCGDGGADGGVERRGGRGTGGEDCVV